MSVVQSPASQLMAPTFQFLNIVPFDFWGAPVVRADDGTLVCPGFVGNTIADNAWDKVLIAGAPSPNIPTFTPGIAEVHVTKGRDVDRKKSAGQDGGTLTLHGVALADVEIQLLIWTPDQLDLLNKIWSQIMPRVGKGTPNAYDVQHPKLKMHDVKAIQVIKGSGPDPGPVPRSRIFTIHAVEFIAKQPKKNVTKSDQQSIGSLNDAPAYPTPGTNVANTGPTP